MIALVVLLAAQAPAPPPPQAAAARSVDDELSEVRRLGDDLACDRLVPLARALAADARANAAERQEARFRVGYCQAVNGSATDAEETFTGILVDDIAAKPGFPMEKWILDLLEGARARRAEEVAAEKVAARKKLADSVKLLVHEPLNLKGGQRAVFVVELTDPHRAVKSMRVDFFKEGEREPYGVPMFLQRDGTWRGEVAGTYTRSRVKTHIRYAISASDDAGVLAQAGTLLRPRVIDIDAGSDVALDLRAAERLSKPARGLYALFGVPTITAAFFVGGAAVGLALANGLASVGANFFGVAAFAVLPPVAAVVGNGISTQFLLDDNGPWIPAGVVAGAGAVWATGVFLAWTEGIAAVDANAGVPSAKIALATSARDKQRVGIGTAVAVTGASLGFLSSVVVPTVMVVYDNLKDEGVFEK